jgi:fatty-acyl-CoA synthase
MSRYTVAELLRKNRSAKQVGESRIAVTYQGTSLTYDELDRRSDQLAAALAALGFAHGERVAVVAHNCLQWVEIFFAVGKLGGVVVPINYLLRPQEVEFILADSGATWVFFQAGLAGTLARSPESDAGRNYVLIDEPSAAGTSPYDYERLIASAPQGRFEPAGYDVHTDDLLLLQYTSGTTGTPKGAMHTHSTVLWNSIHQVVDFGITADEVAMVVPALCWAAGLHDLALATLWSGGRIVLSPSTGFAPPEFLRTAETERVTSVLLVPTVLKRVLADPSFTERDLSSLRVVLSGGEPVPVTAIEDLHTKLPTCALLQCYGMSEFPTIMLYVGPGDARRKVGAAGRACSIAEIRVVDAAGADVLPGEVGEIICRSPAMMLGYYGREDASASTLVDGWLHTGDLATVDDEGYVYVAGRSKDMLITGGLNVYPAEVERVIAQHPAVAEAAVVGQPDEQWGETGVAFVVLADGHRVEETELVAFLRDELATYKIPRRFEITTRPLPRTTSGKVQKFRLLTS